MTGRLPKGPYLRGSLHKSKTKKPGGGRAGGLNIVPWEWETLPILGKAGKQEPTVPNTVYKTAPLVWKTENGGKDGISTLLHGVAAWLNEFARGEAREKVKGHGSCNFPAERLTRGGDRGRKRYSRTPSNHNTDPKIQPHSSDVQSVGIQPPRTHPNLFQSPVLSVSCPSTNGEGTF